MFREVTKIIHRFVLPKASFKNIKPCEIACEQASGEDGKYSAGAGNLE